VQVGKKVVVVRLAVAAVRAVMVRAREVAAAVVTRVLVTGAGVVMMSVGAMAKATARAAPVA